MLLKLGSLPATGEGAFSWEGEARNCTIPASPPDPRYHQELPHLHVRRMIAGFTLSYIRSVPLLCPEGIRMMANLAGQRLGNNISEAAGICER
jgi:hypothetical protein